MLCVVGFEEICDHTLFGVSGSYGCGVVQETGFVYCVLRCFLELAVCANKKVFDIFGSFVSHHWFTFIDGGGGMAFAEDVPIFEGDVF